MKKSKIKNFQHDFWTICKTGLVDNLSRRQVMLKPFVLNDENRIASETNSPLTSFKHTYLISKHLTKLLINNGIGTSSIPNFPLPQISRLFTCINVSNLYEIIIIINYALLINFPDPKIFKENKMSLRLQNMYYCSSTVA